MSKPSISFVLLAYNEEACIAQAIAECRAFGRERCSAYEIVLIDDGSTDATKRISEQASDGGDVRVLSHPRNLGMGASMRDGYRAARCDYIAHLPGDRQVRAGALAEMLPLCSAETIALSFFRKPPSGRRRALMSAVFRTLLQGVGGFKVDFAGTYLFHRSWLEKVDLRLADSETFLFSFQLLELFRRAGARFSVVPIDTYLRENGQSRVATVPRIARMFAEIGRARMHTRQSTRRR